jgi:hypothetical protein
MFKARGFVIHYHYTREPTAEDRRTICFEPIGGHNAVEESVRDRAHA